MTFEELKNKAKSLPPVPGVYLFKNQNDEIIYVGKAKNLKNRVSSYFNKHQDRYKTQLLVRHIDNFDFVTVETETDAFLLENILIKKHKPKYNIQLKDDKSYPWIVIKNEHFPRVLYTRQLVKDGSEYFGPYTSVNMVRAMINMFKKMFKIRTCKLDLSPAKIKTRNYRPCLQYHINNCLAPCIQKQTEDDYDKKINQIRKILKGKVNTVISELKTEMFAAAEKLDFEKAEELKQNIDRLENYQSRSTVVSAQVGTLEVYSITSDEKYAYVNFLKVSDGKIVQAYSTEIKKKLQETDKEILETAIIDIRENIQQGISKAREIVVPFELDLDLENVKIHIPQRGIKRQLLEMSQKNVQFYRKERERQRLQASPNRRSHEILERMKRDLNLKELPVHIECFDNSNLQGTNAVSSCVVFKNAKPSKKDYRKFNVKTVEGPDDYATMREVIYRRYKRLLDEGKELPQLIIIDGGKGQLQAAIESLMKLRIDDKVEIISIAKRLEEIFRPDDPYPLYIDKNSITLKIIQQARDEAHRFGITFHRQKRAKDMLHTQLSEIPGIGEKTIRKLLIEIGGIEALMQVSEDKLAEIIGQHKAKLISDFLRQQEND